jgi:hypothetical protein
MSRDWIELREMWRTNQLVNPRTGRRIAQGGPTYNALLAEFEGSPERTDFLRRYTEDCIDERDPITYKYFSDMSIDELRNIVQIGTGPKKNCYSLDSIFEWITRHPENPKNPMTAQPIPPEQVEAIIAAHQRMHAPPPIEYIDDRQPNRRSNIRAAERIVSTGRWGGRDASNILDALRVTRPQEVDEFFPNPDDLHRFVWARLHGVNM